MTTIDRIISYVSTDLGVAPPKLTPVKKLPGTHIARLSPDGKRIELPEDTIVSPDTILAIIHELRHAWQMAVEPERYFAL